MKATARLPLAQLEAENVHVEAFKALAHLGRLQVFFVLVRAQGEVSAGEIQEAVGMPGPRCPTISTSFAGRDWSRAGRKSGTSTIPCGGRRSRRWCAC